MRTLSSYTFIIVCFLFFGVLKAQNSLSAGVASLDETLSLADPIYLPIRSTAVVSTSSNKLMFRALPTLTEGQGAISDFLRKTIVYPEIAVENGIEGRVVVAITVGTNGAISDVKMVESLFGPIDQLVIAGVKELPRLAPAVFNAQAVKKELLIPVHFSLQ